ncbi:MAG: hypothetical protein HFH21_09685 [Ruminococcus sp.]|jgi:hypothetical protein|nr:hypothetical protein [uncultured Schaedlerella sp.]MCI8768036.1 hypothetical protein [Ruminococcus sp.]
MTLTREEHLFVMILVINLAVAAAYLICGLFIAVPIRKKKNEEAEFLYDGRKTYIIRFFIMVLCPVVAPVFFFVTHLLYLTIFRFQVNLEDVIFDKSRVKTQVKANEERERNVIPVEDALAVSDEKNLRVAMMNIIKGDMQESLSSVALALNSEDSESAHYAASILSDRLNEFRMGVHKLYRQMKEDQGSEQIEYEVALIAYMEDFLSQRVFMDLEQDRFVRMLEEAMELLYEKNASRITPEWYEGLCMRLLESRDFENVEKWCIRLEEQYPNELCAYTCRLKLYFTVKNRDAFFQTLNALKNSNITIDSDTLEMIRIFS